MQTAVPSAGSPSFCAKSPKYLNGKEEERGYDGDDDAAADDDDDDDDG
jgi:hypothetical protein